MSYWIEWTWTPEKPHPETLDTKVHVRFRDGIEVHKAREVRRWFSLKSAQSHWYQGDYLDADITHYRVVEAA